MFTRITCARTRAHWPCSHGRTCVEGCSEGLAKTLRGQSSYFWIVPYLCVWPWSLHHTANSIPAGADVAAGAKWEDGVFIPGRSKKVTKRRCHLGDVHFLGRMEYHHPGGVRGCVASSSCGQKRHSKRCIQPSTTSAYGRLRQLKVWSPGSAISVLALWRQYEQQNNCITWSDACDSWLAMIVKKENIDLNPCRWGLLLAWAIFIVVGLNKAFCRRPLSDSTISLDSRDYHQNTSLPAVRMQWLSVTWIVINMCCHVSTL